MSAQPAPSARRADARRNVERILDATIEELSDDPEASMAAVARRAGVARATVYVHFPTREALIAAVTERAMTEATAAMSAAAPEEDDPAEALARVLTATWRTLGRYRVLIEVNTRLGRASDHAMHEPVFAQLGPLLERGRASGAFTREPPLEWLLTVVIELVHAASREVAAGRLDERAAERALLTSVTGALAAPAGC